MTIWNIPKTFTQGDRITWSEQLDGYNPATDTLSCFIRGQSALNITGTPRGGRGARTCVAPASRPYGSWEFVIESIESQALTPGKYKTQFVISADLENRQTLGSTDLLVHPSFENLTELECHSADEIELELITTAIAKLVTGAVAEYRVGDRMMRYTDLEQLTKRQAYLRRRIAIASLKVKAGGRSVPIRFSNQ